MTVGSLTVAEPRDSGILGTWAIVMLGVSGALIVVTMPGVLTALAGARHLSSGEVALLASAEMAGLTAATLVISGWIARVNRRLAACVSLLLLIAAHVASIFATSIATFLAVRFVAGMCEGVILAIMSAVATTTTQPDRIFAIYLAANLAISTLLFAILRHLAAIGKAEWVFLLFVLMTVTPLLLLPWLPSYSPAAAPVRSAVRPKGAFWGGLGGLAGTLILLIGVGATWPLVGQMGLALGFSAETVAGVLSIATAAGIVSGIAVYFLGQRWGRRVPVAGGTLALALVMLAFMHAHDVMTFSVITATFMFLWVAILPYYSGVMAFLDPSGRLSSLCMAMQFLGLAIGPLLATALLPHGTSLPLWLGVICCIPATLLMLYAERQSRARSSATAGAVLEMSRAAS